MQNRFFFSFYQAAWQILLFHIMWRLRLHFMLCDVDVLKLLCFETLTYCCLVPLARIFFINPCPVCYDTEKGGEGGTDTGITTRRSVTRHVARGYLRSCSLRRCWGTYERPLPPSPHIIPPHLSSFQLSRYILRMASNLEVVSMTADVGQ